jgi:hypothetical protein
MDEFPFDHDYHKVIRVIDIIVLRMNELVKDTKNFLASARPVTQIVRNL